jgi:hypothetical protein
VSGVDDGLKTRRWNGTKSAFADCTSDAGAGGEAAMNLGFGHGMRSTIIEMPWPTPMHIEARP